MPAVRRAAALILWWLLIALPLAAQSRRPVTFTDLMQFRAMERPAVSPDGAWIAYGAVPDRGDAEGVVQAVDGGARYTVPRGVRPLVADDARHVAFRVEPPLAATEKAKDAKDKPKPGLALVATATGAVEQVEDVQSFAFSDDGRFLAYHHGTRRTPDDTTRAAPKRNGRQPGTLLVVRDLAQRRAVEVPFVKAYAFSDDGRYLAYAVADTAGQAGLYVRNLADATLTEQAVDARRHGHYASLRWAKTGSRLAFLAATEDAKGKPGPAGLWLWDGTAARALLTDDDAPVGAMIPADQSLTWTDDGARLFFGFRPRTPPPDTAKADSAAFDPYDQAAILKGNTLDVWHWTDPRISTHQKQVWKAEQARVDEAVYHLDAGRYTLLGGPGLRLVERPQNATVALARADSLYLRRVTWDGTYYDLYAVWLGDGRTERIAEGLEGPASLAPEGRYAAFFRGGHWFLYDVATGSTRNATAGLGVAFADELDDTPDAPSAYGLAGWTEGDAALLVYDRFDVWQIPTAGGAPTNVTAGAGRRENRRFRIVRTDPEQRAFAPGATLLLEGYHDVRKNEGFWQARLGEGGVEKLIEDDKQFTFVARPERAERLFFTREAYDEFPDLWVSDLAFRRPRRLTDVNPQMRSLAWGSAELVSWANLDGVPLQGVLIKPAGYEPGRRYPVLVYFYERFSQRLHEFNQPQVNHRPAFALYASDGYAIFLPDVVYEEGRPGLSAVKALVPGVQKLVDLGVADPAALGLHGHSWSGYQTAYVVTQTNIFAAAVAGAPVSNMTSAYGGIRWGTGLARQFQYEQTQSRLGRTLWDGRDRYIDNSPLFFADRLNTPLLLMHGDADGAVPWEQSIELYLACRRLDKDCIFLQYRGEDHHPAQYANKLDYAIRMKEYFDHYLKGEPAPAWIRVGLPYAGE